MTASSLSVDPVGAPPPAARVAGRALLVGSSGGHLTQLRSVGGLWPSDRRCWVTFDTADAISTLTGEQVVWAHHPTTRNVPNLLRNVVLAWRVLRRERPDVVVSTGAGVAVPFFVLARLMRVPTVFIEVYDRIDSATLTGRLCRPFASLLLVQWESQRAVYPEAVLVGPLL